jgi:hypothetical protein
VLVNYNTERRSATYKQKKHEVLENLLWGTEMCGKDQMECKA